MEGIDEVLGIESTIDIALERLMAEESFHVGSDYDATGDVLVEALATILHPKQFVALVTKVDVGVPSLPITCGRGA